MKLNVKTRGSVSMVHVYHFVKLKDSRVACVIKVITVQKLLYIFVFVKFTTKFTLRDNRIKIFLLVLQLKILVKDAVE